MKRAFTLIELLVVISLIGLLSSSVVTALFGTTGDARGAQTGSTKRQLTRAAQYYELDMGFYPPDVNRGWDPGFERPLPWNPDVEDGSHNGSPGINCNHCPPNWQDLIAERWDGPYIAWPSRTNWGGRYDYNYFGNPANRPQGCRVPAGIYVGAQGDYQNNNTIPFEEEQNLVDIFIDDDGCLNGESQLLLFRL